jgi:hypothetical protein
MKTNEKWQEICSVENLRLAYLKARKGKTDREEVKAFSQKADQYLNEISNQLLYGEYFWGNHRSFTIFDPKERTITASPFDQRIVQHAIFNVYHTLFDGFQLDNSFASRPGKGVHKAIFEAHKNCRNLSWFLKLDVRKYFESISHEKLIGQLKGMEPDALTFHQFEQIILSFGDGLGLPIGNLSSQYFANHHLVEMDRFIVMDLKAAAYIRYMDDMVIWDDSKEKVRRYSSILRKKFEDELYLKLKPPCLQPCLQGLPFLGMVLFPDTLKHNKDSQSRIRKKYLLEDSKIRRSNSPASQRSFQVKTQSLFANSFVFGLHDFRKSLVLNGKGSNPYEGEPGWQLEQQPCQ